MSNELVLLAVLMFAVTYPARALGLLTPGLERLPKPALDYLQLVGPAVLTTIAVVGTFVGTDESGAATLHVDIIALGVLACLLITWWRRNLLFGLVAAVAIVGGARALGIADFPV